MDISVIFISRLIDVASRLGGPRLAFQIHLRRLERWRTFEAEYYLLDQLVDPRRAAIDVGGNEGIYAGRLAQLCPRVHCFEPIPWLASGLRARLPRSVMVHQMALSNREGQAELRIPFHEGIEDQGYATLESANALHASTDIKIISCDLNRLDAMVAESVGFIKIDVEGHEMAVLEGATEILTKHRPVLLVESETRHNSAAPRNIFEFLADLGYDGEFMVGEQRNPVSAFRADWHQNVESLAVPVKDGGSIAPRYINNFIFKSRR